MSVTWKAYADRIVIKADPQPTETASGIVIPDKVSTGPVILGTVLAAGPSAAGALAGDRVFFLKKASIEIQPGIYSTLSDSVTAAQRSEGDNGEANPANTSAK